MDRERDLADPDRHADLPVPALPDRTPVVASVEAGAWFAIVRRTGPGRQRRPRDLGVERAVHLADTARSGGSFALTLFVVVLFVQPIAAGVSFVSVAMRYAKAVGDERLQLEVVRHRRVVRPLDVHAHAGVEPSGRADPTIGLLFLYAAIGIAILKYRLYDIDVIINKAVVYGLLAAFITVVYVLIVVVVGTVVGTTQFLALVATAIVAIAFQPMRERAKQTANRLIYGKRATPYEVLSGFSENVGEAFGGEEILPRMARLLAEGPARSSPRCGCASATRCGRPPRGPCAAAAAPSRRTWTGCRRSDVDAAVPSATKAICSARSPCDAASDPHPPRGGEAAVRPRRAGRTRHAELQLIEDLRSSRQRLVAAQDEGEESGAQHPRRRAAAVGRARREAAAGRRAGRSRGAAKALARGHPRRRQDALENLRDLARGIYPPLLADQGWPPPSRRRRGRRPSRSRSTPTASGASARGGGGGLLLVPRGAAERGEVRARIDVVSFSFGVIVIFASSVKDDGEGFHVRAM